MLVGLLNRGENMNGVDISVYQKNVNYISLKANGIDFAIIRAGYGKNESQKDNQFENHFAGCVYAGIKVGAYLYSYASTIEGARLEAENCLKFIKDKKFDLPIFYDIEDKAQSNVDKETLTKMCQVFCDTIINAGYQAGVYANLYWFNNKVNVKELEKYNIWLAQWNSKITAKFRVDIWQYEVGYTKGYLGKIDKDKCLKDYTNTENNVDIEKLAKEVIEGKWGNGAERVQKLGNLYNEVQKRVNEILSKKQEIIYIVKKGDNLITIAKRYNTTYQKIARDNNIKNPDKIYVGQRIVIK